MDEARATQLVQTALRCYPARWRRRHGDEAAELAELLMSDGTPASSIAWSYLAGAAREWLMPRPGRPLSTIACALLAAACALGVSAGLLAPAAPAKAARPASTSHAHCRRDLPGATGSTGMPSSPSLSESPGSPAPSLVVIPSKGRPLLPAGGHGQHC